MSIKSDNNNAFVYSSYWGNFSRILFHDAGGPGVERMRREYDIPKHVTTVEVDLTAINPTSVLNWRDRVQHINIRCHCTTISAKDKIYGTLPDVPESLMRKWLKPELVTSLIHADYLAFLDFSTATQTNGGARFLDHVKPPMPEEIFHQKVLKGNPLTFGCTDYSAYLRVYNMALSSMSVRDGFLLQPAEPEGFYASGVGYHASQAGA